MWEYNHTDEMYHHGILGMKWGKMNGPPYPLKAKDHSASEKKAGWKKSLKKNKKASEMSDEELQDYIKRKNLESAYNKFHGSENRKLENTKKIVDSASMALNQVKEINKETRSKERLDLTDMSDKELRDRINRENLERQYNNMFNKPEASKGQQYVDKILSYGAATLGLASSSLAIALAIKELKK